MVTAMLHNVVAVYLLLSSQELFLTRPPGFGQRLPAFTGRNFLTTTGSSATSHCVSPCLSFLLRRLYSVSVLLRLVCRLGSYVSTMQGFPSYCTGSLLMTTSSITNRRCSRIGHRAFLHARPASQPKQVHLR